MTGVEWFTRGRWWYQRVANLTTFLACLRQDGITLYRINGGL